MIEGPKTMQNPQIRIGIAIQIFLGPKPKKMVKLRDRKVVKLFLITIFFLLLLCVMSWFFTPSNHKLLSPHDNLLLSLRKIKGICQIKDVDTLYLILKPFNNLFF